MPSPPQPPDGELLEWAAAAGQPEEAAIPLLLPLVAAACRPCGAHLTAAEEALRALSRGEPGASRSAWLLAALGVVNPRRCLPEEFRVAQKARRKLRKLVPEKRVASVQRGRWLYRTPAVVVLLLEEVQKVVPSDPEAALGWLEVAGEIVPLLTAAGYAEPVTAALGVRVAAHRANALRVSGDLAAADRRFRRLRRDPRRRQVFDLAVHAEVASFEGSLRHDQRRFRAAAGFLRKAERFFRSAGDGQGRGKVLIKWGNLANQRADFPAAAAAYRSALAALDARRAARLVLMAKNNLAHALSNLGEFAEAARLVAEARPLYRRFAEPWVLLRLAWLEGRIARGLGEGDAAEGCFRRALQMSLDAGNGFDAALLGMELAALYLAEGRTGAVKDLSAQLAAAFHLRGVHLEMVKALRLFQRAAAQEQATAALVAALRDYLRRAEHDPALPFRA